jgi:hypothetical protein
MALPPIHRCDHTPVFVSVLDDCWDIEKLEADLEAIEKQAEPDAKPTLWGSVGAHPLHKYWSGEGRADLNTVKDWMLPDKTPVMFVLRRLKLDKWAMVEQFRERGLMVESRLACVRHGLASVSGAEMEISTDPVSNEDLEKIKAILGHEEFKRLANVIYVASVGVLPSEAFR